MSRARCERPGSGQTVGGSDVANRICSIEGCGRPLYARGWCKTPHYYSWWKWGDPEHVSPLRRPEIERFWAKVDQDGPVPKHRPELGQCWVWTANTIPKGYGLFGRKRYAHRYSWTLHYGTIPGKLWVLHKCDNPPCVRPDHLFLGTARDNYEDMRAKGRRPLLLNDEAMAAIEVFLDEGKSVAEMARTFDVGWTTAKRAVIGCRGGC